MNLGIQGLFFFSAIGAFNGFLAGLLVVFFHKKKNLATYFLGILLIMVSLRIGKSAIYFFTKDISRSFLQMGLTACYLIGPSLYFYSKSSLKRLKALSPLDWVHIAAVLIPPLVLGLIFPFANYQVLWGKYIWHLINLQLTIYILISAFLLKPVFIKRFKRRSKLEKDEYWPLIIFIGNLIVCLANVAALFTTYILGSLSFSVVFYSALFILLSRERKTKQLSSYTSPHSRKINPEQADLLLAQLASVMQTQQLYKQPHLKLPEVAKALNISPHQLSQLVNEHLEKSFSQLISEYRIEEACRLLQSLPHHTYEAIGYDAGFASKSTFFTTFKKIKGETPSQYKKALI